MIFSCRKIIVPRLLKLLKYKKRDIFITFQNFDALNSLFLILTDSQNDYLYSQDQSKYQSFPGIRL